MHTKNTLSYKLTAALLLALLLVSSLGGVRPALAAGPLTSTACTSPAAGSVTCELWATTGSITPAGSLAPITIWGYADSAAGSASLPGPVLIANQGDSVTVILHNNLAVATSLRFEGQGLRPDRTGAAPAGTATYTFTASQPGVFLYEAGPVPGAQYQAAMGMSGALVVRPAAAGQAYASAASAYTDEALVVLSEIDPVLNASATPASFDMRKFKPKYFLINGQAYPDTSPIGVSAGSSVLLRYVNAGQQVHTMALLGMQQTFLSYAGAELPNYRKGASQLLMPGRSADAIAVVPAAAAAGARFALYEAGALLTNNGSQAFGGMLAFLEVGGTPPGGDILGPAASGLLLSENPTNGLVNVSLSATISDVGRGDAVIQAAEYFIDVAGGNGTGIAMSGAFAASTESVSATLLSADLLLLSSGNHTLYVHGQDANGNWGSFNTIVLNLDKTGPTTSGITFNPAIANSSAVAIQATGNDSASGGGNIVAAEYFIDASPLPDDTVRGTAMTVNGATPIASLTGSILAADVANLVAGDHTISVRSQDALGNWGALASATLKVDRTGPATTNIVTTPLATNGTTSVRVDALVTDLVSKITNAELFIDNPNIVPGNGLGMYAKDGSFNGLSEAVYQTISQVQANALSAGAHTVYVRGKDAAGNWGVAATYTLISDKVKPVASNPGFNPNPVNANDSTTNNTSFNLTFSADGTGTNITQAEWFEGADPGVGKGKQFAAFTAASPINLSTPVNFVALGMMAGNHTLNMRAKDAANNWSNIVSVTVNVIYPNAVFADGFESGFSAWSATSGIANISVVASPVQAGLSAMAAAINAGVSGYVQDNTPFQDASYHARFYVNPGSLAYTTNGVATTARTIFLGLSPTNGNVFNVQMRRTSTTGSFQVRAQVFRAGGGGGVSTTAWFTIPSASYTAVEINWSSATSAAFTFYVHTATLQQQTFTAINTSAYKLDTVRLGPQGSWTNVSGTMYFDSFASTRRTNIGP